MIFIGQNWWLIIKKKPLEFHTNSIKGFTTITWQPARGTTKDHSSYDTINFSPCYVCEQWFIIQHDYEESKHAQYFIFMLN